MAIYLDKTRQQLIDALIADDLEKIEAHDIANMLEYGVPTPYSKMKNSEIVEKYQIFIIEEG